MARRRILDPQVAEIMLLGSARPAPVALDAESARETVSVVRATTRQRAFETLVQHRARLRQCNPNHFIEREDDAKGAPRVLFAKPASVGITDETPNHLIKKEHDNG